MIREGVIKSRTTLNEVPMQMGLADDVDRKFPLQRHARLRQQHGRSADRHDPGPRRLRQSVHMPDAAADADAGAVRAGPPADRAAAPGAAGDRAGHRHRPGTEVRLRRRQGQQGRLSPREAGTGVRRSAGDRRRAEAGRPRGGQRPAADPAGDRGEGRAGRHGQPASVARPKQPAAKRANLAPKRPRSRTGSLRRHSPAVPAANRRPESRPSLTDP